MATKTFTFQSLAIVAAMALTMSCKDDNNVPDVGLAAPNAAGFQNLRKEALADLVQNATFKAEEAIAFTSEKGAKVFIGANCLRDESNNAVTGDVSLSFVEIYDRGNMVATNKPLMGKDPDDNLLPLVTGGEYKIEIRQGDKNLHSVCGVNVTIPADLTGGLDNAMILWKGQIDEDGNLAWEEALQGEIGKGRDDGGGDGGEFASYNIWDSQFGWTNVDRFWSDSRPKTQIKVTVPDGYDHKNAGVYLSYQGESNLLAQLDVYNAEGRFFTEHYGFVPIGMTLHVVFTSESNGQIVHAIKQATIAKDAVISIAPGDLSTIAKADLVKKINALP